MIGGNTGHADITRMIMAVIAPKTINLSHTHYLDKPKLR